MQKRVLYVEDEDFFAKTLSRSLEHIGCEVVVAPDGEEGLTRIQKERFDIILLDLLLPKKDGFEILQAVKTEPATKDIPIVIVSNLFSDEDQKKVTALGVKHYFVKAFTDPRTIVSYVGKALGLTEAKQADGQTGNGEGVQ
jgi:two-component system response regulator VanR